MKREAGERDPALARLQDAVRRLQDETRGRTRTGLTHDAADDTVGSLSTDDALSFDPLPLLRALARHGARVAVMGQVAGIMHGSSELTGDLDLLWDGDAAQAEALATAFSAIGTELTDDDGRPLPCDPAAFHLPKVLFRSPFASGDCCTPRLPWGDLSIGAFLLRVREATTRDGLTIRYLDRQDLITMRGAIGRPKDVRRAAELERLALP